MADSVKKTVDRIIGNYISELKQALDSLDRARIHKAVGMILSAYINNRKVFIMGNGGSAANASHFACDLSKNTLERVDDNKEKRFKVYSLTDNTALLTAFANDFSFEDVFLQQLRNLIGANDVLIVLSGSGQSKNLIKAVTYAKKRRAKIIGILGFVTGGTLGKLADCPILIQSKAYGPCEDIQLVLDHIITTSLSVMKKNHAKKK
ncbi:MAG: hypothetical protein UV73_C0005G0080 [Candidatus Gottesmanbacteria bacterium GW2011_GWA2_43_14]|uniref:SIS domain-containing protein n=1 Tax=Candidatus Gottesmanbacteria bacterium GW2011_GWA2_43_14 TaxID=1618443 RepID=A0A0G1GG48_9BACT|nr:MAG: hypothetical protein UV73_C0005G0080 [Candidatus Gottesmanbacteria bacterium GW2011_GWA2_43_14]